MIQPDRVLAELSDLWVTLGKEHDGAGLDGVLRACALTLVVIADAEEDPGVVGETLAELMRDHPSRAIVVRVSGDAATPLDSRVFAQCWMPFGRRQQICCEQIEITASEAELEQVPAVVLPLTVADLPVIVWNRTTRALPGAAADGFARIATKTIVDTANLPEARAALRNLAERVAAGEWIADLPWARITRWRELIAQIFENPVYAAHLAGIDQVEIRHTGASAPVSACYLGAWLTQCLGRAGARVAVTFGSTPDSIVGNLSRVTLMSSTGELKVSIGRLDGASGEIRVNQLVSRTVFSKPVDSEQLREELSINLRDRVWEQALPQATALCEGLP